jgi:hypothetical protein
MTPRDQFLQTITDILANLSLDIIEEYDPDDESSYPQRFAWPELDRDHYEYERDEAGAPIRLIGGTTRFTVLCGVRIKNGEEPGTLRKEINAFLADVLNAFISATPDAITTDQGDISYTFTLDDTIPAPDNENGSALIFLSGVVAFSCH